MPIYEYYCPDNNRIYQFYAKTLAQAKRVPKCPDNPKYRMEKVVSRFAVNTGGKKEDSEPATTGGAGGEGGQGPDDARMDAAMDQMEKEFANVDENDPRAMGRMMRRMAEVSGEKIEGEMEEVVRKLEEGTDPDALEEKFGGGETQGGEDDPFGEGLGGDMPPTPDNQKEPKTRLKARRPAPTRDPKMYDFE